MIKAQRIIVVKLKNKDEEISYVDVEMNYKDKVITLTQNEKIIFLANVSAINYVLTSINLYETQEENE